MAGPGVCYCAVVMQHMGPNGAPSGIILGLCVVFHLLPFTFGPPEVCLGSPCSKADLEGVILLGCEGPAVSPLYLEAGEKGVLQTGVTVWEVKSALLNSPQKRIVSPSVNATNFLSSSAKGRKRPT